MKLIDADEFEQLLVYELIKQQNLERGCHINRSLHFSDILAVLDQCQEYGHPEAVACVCDAGWCCSRCKAEVPDRHADHCPNCGARFISYDEWVKEN